MDTDFEEVSVTETLSRHRTILENLCKNMKLNVVEVLEEVVSGESLYTRPQMMRLLDMINLLCGNVHKTKCNINSRD